MADPSLDDGGGPAGDMPMPADSKYANFKLPDMGKSFEEKQEEARRVLTELYTAYAPKKLNDIPTLLEAYAGQEDELIASARLKYAKADQVYKKKRGFGKQGASSSSSGGGGGGDGSGGGGAGGTLGSTMAHSLSCSSHGKGMVDGEAGRLKTKARCSRTVSL